MIYTQALLGYTYPPRVFDWINDPDQLSLQVGHFLTVYQECGFQNQGRGYNVTNFHQFCSLSLIRVVNSNFSCSESCILHSTEIKELTDVQAELDSVHAISVFSLQ